MLEDAGYADLPAHKAIHKAFLEKMESFQKDYESGCSGVPDEIMQFLSEWITKNIGKKYGSNLTSKHMEDSK